MSDLAPIFSTQNVHDDDADVIASYDIEVDAPPNLKDAVEPIPIPAPKPLPLITKILSGELVIDPLWSGATLILPADANRKTVYLRVYSPTAVATDGVRIASDIGLLPGSGKVLHNYDWSINAHTGAVWVTTCTLSGGSTTPASAKVAVEYWSVTE